LACLKQSSVSKIEARTRSLSAEEVVCPSHALDKPILYFFSEEFREDIAEDELTSLQQDLIMQARRLTRDDLRKLAAQARAVADLKKWTDPVRTLRAPRAWGRAPLLRRFVIPGVCFVAVLLVAASALLGSTDGCYWLVPVMILLIFQGTLNAWDLLLRLRRPIRKAE
jgi:hypothetical protein